MSSRFRLPLVFASLLTVPLATAGATDSFLVARLEPTMTAAKTALQERILVPEKAREPVLMAAHHAYALWSQQFMASLLEDSQTAGWKQFLGMDVRMGDAYRQLGQTAYQEERYDDAAKLLRIATDFLEPDAQLLAETGYSLKETGQYERGTEFLLKATQLDGANPEYWVWLGDAQRLQGHYDDAYRNMLTAKELAPENGVEIANKYVEYTLQLTDMTPSWENFEIHREFAGRHQEANRVFRMVAEFMTALAVAPDVQPDDKESLFKKAWVNMQLGTQLAFLKRPALAVDFYRQSSITYGQTASQMDVMRVEQNEAIAYDLLADQRPRERKALLEESAKHWEESLRLAREVNDGVYARHAAGGLLATLAAVRPLDDARLVEVRAMVAKEIPWKGPINEFTVATAARGEVECRLREDDFGGARVLIELADSYYKDTGYLVDLEYRAMSQVQLGEVYLAQEQPAKAAEVAAEAVEQVTKVRAFLAGDDFLRSMNPQTLRRAVTLQALAALAGNEPGKAVDLAEKYQCQLAQDLLASRVRDESWRTDFATEEHMLLDRDGWYKNELSAATEARDTARMDWLQARMDESRSRVERIVRAQSLPSNDKLSYRPVSPENAADLKTALPADTTVLYLLVGSKAGAGLLLSATQLEGVKLPGATEEAVEDLVLAARAACDARQAADATKALTELRELLLDPLKGKLPETGTLVLACDDLTTLLPLRAMDPDAEFIPKGLRICVAPGASVYLKMMDARGSRKAAGLDALAADSAATLATATPSGGALVNTSLDLDSGDPTLALWNADAADPTRGLLTAALIHTTLPHAVLGLNAEIHAGAEARPQLHFAAMEELAWRAGTPTLVANQWPVDAAVRDAFFTAFTASLSTQSPLEAYTTAIDVLRASHPDTLDWGAFVYLGAS